VLELANIPVFIGEVAYNDNPFVLQSSPRTYQYRTNSIMFYKENIMAQIASQLPETFTKLILLDADILFVDPDWYTKVSHALDTRVVVQPFFRAFQLDITFHVGSTKHSRLSDGDNNHDGYAWAFQRSWLHNHPLFEYSLIGGGDTSIYNMAIKHRNSAAIGYVNLDILHLPHGTLRNRQYESRHDKITTILARNKLSSLADAVVRTSSGIFEWKEQYRIAMNDVLLTYFKSRDDDGI
jgi:hypothetical protein